MSAPRRTTQIVFNALKQFGFGTVGLTATDLQVPGAVIQMGVKPNRIDLLTGISGVEFEEAWPARTDADLDGTATHYIGLTALLRNKEQTGRAKDLGDAEELRKRLHESEPD